LLNIHLGDVEVREAQYNKAKFFYRIGDKDEAVKQFHIANEKTIGSASKIDVQFALIRLGLAFNDTNLLTKSINQCKSLIESGGDW
jgi:26S proteasome regulatory subunit N7